MLSRDGPIACLRLIHSLKKSWKWTATWVVKQNGHPTGHLFTCMSVSRSILPRAFAGVYPLCKPTVCHNSRGRSSLSVSVPQGKQFSRTNQTMFGEQMPTYINEEEDVAWIGTTTVLCTFPCNTCQLQRLNSSENSADCEVQRATRSAVFTHERQQASVRTSLPTAQEQRCSAASAVGASMGGLRWQPKANLEAKKAKRDDE